MNPGSTRAWSVEIHARSGKSAGSGGVVAVSGWSQVSCPDAPVTVTATSQVASARKPISTTSWRVAEPSNDSENP